jgi:hypothetical protein
LKSIEINSDLIEKENIMKKILLLFFASLFVAAGLQASPDNVGITGDKSSLVTSVDHVTTIAHLVPSVPSVPSVTFTATKIARFVPTALIAVTNTAYLVPSALCAVTRTTHLVATARSADGQNIINSSDIKMQKLYMYS